MSAEPPEPQPHDPTQPAGYFINGSTDAETGGLQPPGEVISNTPQHDAAELGFDPIRFARAQRAFVHGLYFCTAGTLSSMLITILRPFGVPEEMMIPLVLVLSFGGWIGACSEISYSKGYSRLFGILGLLAIPGVGIVLLLLPTRRYYPQMLSPRFVRRVRRNICIGVVVGFIFLMIVSFIIENSF